MRWFFEFFKNEETSKMKKVYYYEPRNFGTLKFSLSRNDLMEKFAILRLGMLTDNECTKELFLMLWTGKDLVLEFVNF